MTSFAVLGGTGEVGREVVRHLCLLRRAKPDLLSKVTVYGRRDLSMTDALRNDFGTDEVANEKLKDIFSNFINQERVDYDHLEQTPDFLKGFDIVICCLGASQRTSGPEGFQKIDVEYVVKSAQAAVNNSVKRYLLCSSITVSPNALWYPMRIKAEAELQLRKCKFELLGIFRPSVLKCDRKEATWLQTATLLFARFDFWNLGSIRTSDVAAAMIQAGLGTVDEAAGYGKKATALDTDAADSKICEYSVANMLRMSQQLQAALR